ncbi:acyl-CoA dehydratase activase [Desulfolutivibrio sulfoxidireducens]|uniref:acyl-CoA dehydratase activase n=1 Tax=Desulfolutivibrio sulfoxidireducens TaxID=2773299 RepID=UPI00159E07EA|nr:acyl-CoA dehydratase activase [Desulfolutivibrio sulfoxidireducens]QLA16344.1 CoA activase [Desulfolutivibrio sulfoxidireducens]
MRYDIGVDVGAVSVNCAVLDADGQVVHETPYTRHFGRASDETRQVLASVLSRFEASSVRSVSFTGSRGERLAETLGAPFEVETIAQTTAVAHLVPGVRSIIAMGGQDAALFQIAYDAAGNWSMESFAMNGPCASGTGSFIDQQAERLALAMYGGAFDMDQEKLDRVLADFVALGLTSTYPAHVACRCTVFTKSDMIHLQNKGETLPNIIAGLHHGTAANFVSTMLAGRALAEPVVLIGGPAGNELLAAAFRRYFPSLAVPPRHASMGAIGAALCSRLAGRKNAVDTVLLQTSRGVADEAFKRAPRLVLTRTVFDPDNSPPPPPEAANGPIPAWLGVDIGSTSTKYALVDASGRLLHKKYVPTRGKPIEVVRELLSDLTTALGGRFTLMGVATTGSGRNVAGDFLDADLIIDEITAHARGAVAIDPEIDTIFEIGGQDSKYIAIDNSRPTDFVMNKICAAGTGSFLHELANKLKINIVGEFQDVALAATNPVALAERCTVFMESDLAAHAQKGAKRADLIAGLCYAIVHNYLRRVVENRRIGQRIMFLGGPSLNKGIVAAFEKILDRPILVPRHREVMGAYGVALFVRDAFLRGEKQPKKRHIEDLAAMKVDFKETICRADKTCGNECKLKIYHFGGRKSVWGGDCGRYEARISDVTAETDFFKLRDDMFRRHLDAAQNGAPGPDAPLAGVPMALHSLEWAVFWTRLLAECGFRVIQSPRTNRETVTAGVESMTAETCFPIKVFHGHVKGLLGQADFLFLPTVVNIPSARETEKGLFCPMVQSAKYLVKTALGIPGERIIGPTLHLAHGPRALAAALHRSLPPGLRPTEATVLRAVREALAAQKAFSMDLMDRGREILGLVPETEPVWIVSGRPYNLHDERLSLGLGRLAARLGVKAIPTDFLSLSDTELTGFQGMYWGLGGRILRAATQTVETPNRFGVHLGNFSCGPDSFLEHFYGHIMGDKPFLLLELDEHSAAAGMITRMEAFANVVRENMRSPGLAGVAVTEAVS